MAARCSETGFMVKSNMGIRQKFNLGDPYLTPNPEGAINRMQGNRKFYARDTLPTVALQQTLYLETGFLGRGTSLDADNQWKISVLVHG